MGLHELAMQSIETKSNWVRDDAAGVARYVGMLDSLPDYETKAEDAIKKAETELTAALLVVKLARSSLEKKRIRSLQAAE